MKDHIKLTVRRKPDAIIIHVGTNDIGNDIDTITNIQNIVAHIKKKSSHTKIIISSLLIRHSKRKIEEKIKILNNELKTFCEENLVDFLGHENIEVTCLGKGKVHPNKKGNAYLVEYINKNVDILLIVETKLGESFPINQFHIEGYQQFRVDRSSHGGGLIFYVSNNIPVKQIKINAILHDRNY